MAPVPGTFREKWLVEAVEEGDARMYHAFCGFPVAHPHEHGVNR
jgi:hypothetical protein